jgi:hypothetical protein
MEFHSSNSLAMFKRLTTNKAQQLHTHRHTHATVKMEKSVADDGFRHAGFFPVQLKTAHVVEHQGADTASQRSSRLRRLGCRLLAHKSRQEAACGADSAAALWRVHTLHRLSTWEFNSTIKLWCGITNLGTLVSTAITTFVSFGRRWCGRSISWAPVRRPFVWFHLFSSLFICKRPQQVWHHQRRTAICIGKSTDFLSAHQRRSMRQLFDSVAISGVSFGSSAQQWPTRVTRFCRLIYLWINEIVHMDKCAPMNWTNPRGMCSTADEWNLPSAGECVICFVATPVVLDVVVVSLVKSCTFAASSCTFRPEPREKTKANPVIILRLSLACAFVSGVDMDRIQHLAIQNVCLSFVLFLYFHRFELAVLCSAIGPLARSVSWSFLSGHIRLLFGLLS